MTITILDLTTSVQGTTLSYGAPFANSTMDALEEALYVLQELTPVDRDWFRKLNLTGNSVEFTYHGCENFQIRRTGSTTFEIREIGE